MVAFSVAVLFYPSLGCAADEPEPSTAKASVPDAVSLKDATKLVGDLYKGDMTAAKKPEEKAALARKLLQSALETKGVRAPHGA
ncbi:MAG: hypothetical protein NTV46_21195 [Verrucomicrobia bacterium]|nr:hypothetical protein [Verrucomicrobiota bacterium]